MEFKLVHEDVISNEELNTGGVAPKPANLSPMDIWIELAVELGAGDVHRLQTVVSSAINRLDWRITNLPSRWTHVRETEGMKLKFWKAIEIKLNDLCNALDPIPF